MRILFTGGYTGIGLAACRELQQRGPHEIILALRDPSLAHDVNEMDVRKCDLADFQSVRDFAKSVHGHVDVLVCNSAVYYLGPRRQGPSGLDLHLSVCHIGHWLLLYLLQKQVSRVVFVGSALHTAGRIHSVEEKERTGVSYADAKLMQLALTLKWSAVIKEIVVIQPGFVPETGLHRLDGWRASVWWIMSYMWFARSKEEAGRVVTEAILRPASGIVSLDKDLQPIPLPSFSDEEQDRLWELTQKWAGV